MTPRALPAAEDGRGAKLPRRHDVIVLRVPSSPQPEGGHRRLLLAASGALAVVVVAAVLVVALSSGSGTRAPARLPPPFTRRTSLESILNPSNILYADPAGTLEQLKRLGVARVHVYVFWAGLAPDPTATKAPVFNATDPAAYAAADWVDLDLIVRDARALGIGVDLALSPPPPRWASGKGAPRPAAQTMWRPSAPDFGQFVRAMGTRYSGHYTPAGATSPLPRVDHWSVWNEPDQGFQLAPQTTDHSKVEVSGLLYRRLLDAAWSALQATGHGHDMTMIGEIAAAGSTFANAPGLFGAMAPLRFLRALYCVDSSYRPLRGQAAAVRGCPTTAAGSARFAAANPALFHATAFADHPYPYGLPPDKAPADEPDFAELIEIPKLEHALDTLQRVYGSSTRFPIYSTEFGYQTTPPDTEAATVSPALAAYYLNWAEYITWRNPRIRSYDQYLLRDPPTGTFASGIETATGAPKPGFYAYRMPIFLPVTSTDKGHPLEVWGCVRPVLYARRQTRRPQRAQIQFRPASGSAFETVQSVPITDQFGYFDVR